MKMMAMAMMMMMVMMNTDRPMPQLCYTTPAKPWKHFAFPPNYNADKVYHVQPKGIMQLNSAKCVSF